MAPQETTSGCEKGAATTNSIMIYLIAGLITVLINVALVALNLKLYTEYFKDRAITQRTNERINAQ